MTKSSSQIQHHSWDAVRTQFEALGFAAFQYSQSVAKTMHRYLHGAELGQKVGAKFMPSIWRKPRFDALVDRELVEAAKRETAHVQLNLGVNL